MVEEGRFGKRKIFRRAGAVQEQGRLIALAERSRRLRETYPVKFSFQIATCSDTGDVF